MKLVQLLNEIIKEAVPVPEELKGKTWYHGTKEELVQKIISEKALIPPTTPGKGDMSPQLGKVYITSDVKEGIGYAFFRNGGHLEYPRPGWETKEAYGYLVVIQGTDMKEYEPDEDIVADLVGDYDSNKENGVHKYQWLRDLSQRVAPKQFDKYEKQGDYAYGTKLGKMVVKYLTPAQKLLLVLAGKKMGHEGSIPVSEVWKLDQRKREEYLKNPEGFRDISEKLL